MNATELLDLPNEMIVAIIEKMIEGNPEGALSLCTSNDRLAELCDRYGVKDKIYRRWKAIVDRMRDDARNELGDYYSEEEVDQLVSLHLLDNLPEMPEWLAEELELI